MLLGMVRPNQGSVSLFGQPAVPQTAAVWSRVGYLVEAPVAYPQLTVILIGVGGVAGTIVWWSRADHSR